MSDETPKVEKCAWCKSGPSHWNPPYSWTEHTCEQQRFSGPPDQWNSTQLRILAARRADFNAGRLAFRTTGEFAEIPGILAEPPGDNAWVYEDADDYLARGGE